MIARHRRPDWKTAKREARRSKKRELRLRRSETSAGRWPGSVRNSFDAPGNRLRQFLLFWHAVRRRSVTCITGLRRQCNELIPLFLWLILCGVFARAVFDRAQLQAVPRAAKSW